MPRAIAMGTRLEQSGEFLPRTGRASRRQLEDMADSLHRLPSAAEDLQVIIPRRNWTLLLQREFCISLKDPQYAAKKARIEQLYAIADREITPADGDPEIVFCVDEFGPLNLQPRPGGQWAAVSGKRKEPGRAPRPRMRATYTRTAGIRHLFAALELGEDKLYGHIKPRKTRTRFLEFCRYVRSLYPLSTRIAIVCDNFSPHLRTAKDARSGTWAKA